MRKTQVIADRNPKFPKIRDIYRAEARGRKVAGFVPAQFDEVDLTDFVFVARKEMEITR